MPLLVYPLLGIIVQKLMIQGLAPSQQIFKVCFENHEAAEQFIKVVNHGDLLLRKTLQKYPDQQPEDPTEQTGVEISDSIEAKAGGFAIKLDVITEQSMEAAVRSGEFDLGVVELEPPSPTRYRLYHVKESKYSRNALEEIGRRLRIANDRELKGVFGRLKLRDLSVSTFLQSAVELEKSSGVNPLLTFIPLMLVLMTVTGAVYPAIDLTAGERERGTIEILVAAPVSRIMLLFGKFVAVFAVAMLTALANLIAMVVTVYSLGLDEAVFGETGFSLVNLALIMVLLLVLAAFFSATLLCLTSVARSFKEAQAYLIPLMMVAFAPGLLSLAPNLESSAILSVIPLANVVIVGRDLLSGTANNAHVLIALISTLFYCFLALSLAARIFGADALLGDSSGGAWYSIFKKSDVRGSAVPTVAQAIAFLAILFPFFVVASGLVGNLASRLELDVSTRLVLNAVVTFVAFVLLPLCFAFLNRISTPRSFHLQGPSLLGLVAAALLGISVWTLAYELEVLTLSTERATELIEFFSSIKTGFNEVPFPLKLLCLAIVPAVCEEFTFRGIFLSAFRARFSSTWSVVVTAVLFGLFHVFVRDNLFLERFIPSTLMGLLLGVVCVSTRSIFPSMLLHALHNGLLISLSHYEKQLADLGFGLQEQSHLPIHWILIAIVPIGLGLFLLYFAHRSRARLSKADDKP